MESLIAVLLALVLIYLYTKIPVSTVKRKSFGKGLLINTSDPDFKNSIK